MAPVFLIGGGADPDAVRASHEPFVAAAGGGPIVVFVLDEAEHTDVDRWLGALRLAGADDVRAVVVSPHRPPAAGDVDGAAGVFVAGGWTPGYQEVLVTAAGTDWLPREPPLRRLFGRRGHRRGPTPSSAATAATTAATSGPRRQAKTSWR